MTGCVWRADHSYVRVTHVTLEKHLWAYICPLTYNGLDSGPILQHLAPETLNLQTLANLNPQN